MKPFELTLSQQSSNGCYYPEDDWYMEYTINNENELLEALKEAYLRDARNRNDYPIVSFSFSIYYENLNKEQLEIFNKGMNKFEKWKKRIKSLIPRIRKISREKENEIKEKEKLNKLAKKYGYSLIKIVEKKKYFLASIYEEEYAIISKEEKELLEKCHSKNIFIEIENDQYFYSCGSPSVWYCGPKNIEIKTISQSIKEFMSDEDMLEENGNIKQLIEKCKRNK